MANTLIVANWKMHVSLKRGRELAREINNESTITGVEIVICPPFTHLKVVGRQLTDVRLGAQDVFWEVRGPYTGEISPKTLLELGCTYVIVGHSERRTHLAETDEMINRKIKAAFKAGLVPILCIGEALEQRERGDTLQVISEQLKLDLSGLKEIKELVISYEPVWAIGTGQPVEPADLEEAARYIRGFIEEKFDPKVAGQVRLLYGGSVVAENVLDFLNTDGINGVLVGGASINLTDFMNLIRQSQNRIQDK